MRAAVGVCVLIGCTGGPEVASKTSAVTAQTAGDAIELALAAHPQLDVMVAHDATTTPALAGDGLVLSEGVDQLGQRFGADNLTRKHTQHAGQALAGTSLAGLSLEQIAKACPRTGFGGSLTQPASALDLYFPRMSVIDRSSIIDLTPNGVDVDGDPIHVYAGSMLLCDDLSTNVILLGKPYTGSWHGEPATNTLRPYERDLSFLCVKTTDPVPTGDTALATKWRCFHGVLSEGVLGFAYRSVPNPDRQNGGHRTAFVSALDWGVNHWDAMFTHDDGELAIGPIVADWNVNPNDHDGSAAGRLDQHRRFLAAIAVKTTTNRKGITLSPYTPAGPLGEPARVPAAAPATPCAAFSACTAGELGAERDCGWVPDQVHTCTPGEQVQVGMGAAASCTGAPLGRAGGDTILRVCAGVGGCAHANALAENDDSCGSTSPAVAFPCPASGAFSVMKGNHDSASMAGLPWDALGGGVSGDVGTLAGDAHPSVLDACPAGTTGESRDCGWQITKQYTCSPGAAVSIGVDPTSPPSGSSSIVRVCDGRNPCIWTSPRRIAHADLGVVPTVTFLCGPSGQLTVLGGAYNAGDAVTPIFAATGSGVHDVGSLAFAPDVASSGALVNGLLIDVARPTTASGRACDDSWSTERVETGATGIDLARYGFLVGASFDTSSTFTRCPSDEPPPDATDGSPTRTIYITLRAGDRQAFLAPVAGVRFSSLDGMEDSDLPAYSGGPCVAEPNTATHCAFTVPVGRGLTFEATPGDQPIGWSGQTSHESRLSFLLDHDWAIDVDFRANVCGNYKAEPGEDAQNCPTDVPAPPACNHDGICDRQAGESATVCPADCPTATLPDLDARFADFPPDAVPPPLPPPPPDTTAPVITAPNNLSALATSAGGAPIAFTASATDDVDGSVAVTCTPSSGSVFAPGSTLVRCSATDSAGNTAQASIAVDVTDVRIATANDIAVEATGPAGAVVVYPTPPGTLTYVESTTLDACTGAVPPRQGAAVEVDCVAPSGSTFPLGVSQVVCTAPAAQATVSTSFSIAVHDTTPPSITTPGAITTNATSASGAAVSYAVSATDLVDGQVGVTCSPASGAQFAVGTTTVHCSASDHTGNTATSAFPVTIAFAYSGILQPINGDGSSIFKLGSTIAVKFSLGGVPNAVAHLYVAKVSNAIVGTYVEATANGNGDTGNTFRYDATNDTYVFNWSTKGASAGTWQLRIDLGDGVLHATTVSLR